MPGDETLTACLVLLVLLASSAFFEPHGQFAVPAGLGMVVGLWGWGIYLCTVDRERIAGFATSTLLLGIGVGKVLGKIVMISPAIFAVTGGASLAWVWLLHRRAIRRQELLPRDRREDRTRLE